MRAKALRLAEIGVLAVAAALLLSYANPAAAGADPPVTSAWNIVKFPQPQPACTGVGLRNSFFFDRLDCGFGYASVSGTTPASAVYAEFVAADGSILERQRTFYRSAEKAWEFDIVPRASWPAGVVTIRMSVDGAGPSAGETSFFVNQLGAAVAPAPKPGGYAPGDPVALTGDLFEQDSVLLDVNRTNVAGTYSLRLVTPSGAVRGPYGPFTANSGGAGKIAATLPAEATAGITATQETNFRATARIEVVGASYNDLVTGQWAAATAGVAPLTLHVPPSTLVLENSFVSEVGWVKPGERYPFRVTVKNFTSAAATGVSVTVPAADGMSFVTATSADGSGTVSVTPTQVTWQVGTVPAGSTTKTLVVEAEADTLREDAHVVWKNLSTTATLTSTGGPTVTDPGHGPKVIPPGESFDTARYGDRPFPVVPVDYFDRKHEDGHTGEKLSDVINSPDLPGSTFNLYQEMSYGQLFPHGTVPSAGVATSGWDGFATSRLSSAKPQGTCYGTTYKDFAGSSLYSERIRDGWYQLPGDTAYYGADRFGSALPGAIVGIGLLLDIDSACGPTGKLVYDAAAIADPEIDYSDYDFDKDGVVDFFMTVFVGAGGNGVSQTSAPPYDNVWPHSSNLEFYFTDAATGLKGYISDDQLKDLHGRPLFYTDTSYSTMTTTDTGIPVHVRVGPYNVNPETAIDHASVISHEYGHSLGLPDYYSLGSRETYGTWNLMASDHSQHMDLHARQDLGWVVPRVLQPGTSTVTAMKDSTVDTHRIDWVAPDGTPYALTGPSVHNGQAYVAKLPGRRIIDPAKVPSGDHLWWSKSGNDFGCPPAGGHNLDIALPELASVAAGTQVTLTFKTLWDIEWDFDYGFVLVSTDGGRTYSSLPSQNGYTTEQAQNPNANACQSQYGNGITGSSGSYDDPRTAETDRLIGEYPEPVVLEDRYDLSALAGKDVVLRFGYATDPGLARPGWFVDDVTVTAGGSTIYSSDFESGEDDPRVFNGGCNESVRVAANCTAGWQFVSAAAGSPADHAYYLELRDRAGFDWHGKGQSDRGDPTYAPGLYLVYTDEAHGYGNVGTDDPPAQSPLDSQPQPGEQAPNLDDAAWTAAAGDNRFSDSGEGHTDNYRDPGSADELWHLRFGCLTFDVLSMAGDTPGPETVPGDLTADVRFTIGSGCAAFDYGFGGGLANSAPTAVADAKPTTAKVGQKVRFDGSGSSDDADTVDQLTYRWDFDGNGTFDATGRTVTHEYATVGTYDAVLKVTDTDGASGTDSIRIVVEPHDQGGGGGGGAAAPAPPSATPTPAPPAGAVAAATSARTRLVRGKGVIRRSVRGLSSAVSPRPRFTLTSRKLVFADAKARRSFASTRVTTLRFAGRSALLVGVGRLNGKTVRFRLLVVDNGAGRRDTFHLRLSNGVQYHGRLVYGNILVR